MFFGYYFIIEHTFFSPGRFEREANEFAWQLLFEAETDPIEKAEKKMRELRDIGISN